MEPIPYFKRNCMTYYKKAEIENNIVYKIHIFKLIFNDEI